MERLTFRSFDGSAHAKQVGYYQIIDKLAEYEDAEERGLLPRLPCKVGDVLWWTDAFGELRSSEVISMFIEQGIEGIVIETRICNINEKEIGKTVFRTEEEAEKKRRCEKYERV